MSALPYAHPRRIRPRPDEGRPGDRVRTHHDGRPVYGTILSVYETDGLFYIVHLDTGETVSRYAFATTIHHGATL